LFGVKRSIISFCVVVVVLALKDEEAAMLRICVIGLGIMGKNTVRALLRNQLVQVIAGADIKLECREAAKCEFNHLKTYSDYKEMLSIEKPDAVFVTTPDWAHFEPVIACLNDGIHVHVEKPLTMDVEEAKAIVRKAKETGCKLQVAFNHRWLAPYYLTFDLIRQGKVGEPLMAYARKNNPINVPTKMIPWSRHSSPMWFLSCHDIDLVLWWFDDIPVEVNAAGVKRVLKNKFGWDTYDAMQALVKFSRGGIATFESSWIYPETHPALPDSFIEIIGESGHFHLDRKAEAVEMSTEEHIVWPRSLLNYKVFDKWVGAFPSCINSFIDAIIDDREPFVTAYDGYRATLVIDAIHRSACINESIKIQI
jgi:predicted dehydrogenase